MDFTQSRRHIRQFLLTKSMCSVHIMAHSYCQKRFKKGWNAETVRWGLCISKDFALKTKKNLKDYYCGTIKRMIRNVNQKQSEQKLNRRQQKVQPKWVVPRMVQMARFYNTNAKHHHAISNGLTLAKEKLQGFGVVGQTQSAAETRAALEGWAAGTAGACGGKNNQITLLSTAIYP